MKSWLFLLLLVLSALVGRAEPLYPLLSKAQVDSLKIRLVATPSSPARVALLLRLGNDLIAKTTAVGARADSAQAVVQQAQALSQALHFTVGELASNYSSGWLLCNTGQQAAGQQLIRVALERSRQLHQAGQEALGWYYLGLSTMRRLATIATRLNYFEQAARCYGLAHDLGPQAYCLKEVADLHFVQGNYLLARQELLRVEALYRGSGSRRLHYTFDLLAATTTALGNYKDALQYALAAVQSAKSSQDTARLRIFYMRVGNVYQQLNEPEKTIQYYQLAMRSAEQYQDVDIILDMTYSIAKNLIYLQRPQQALALIQQKSKAYPAYDDDTRVSVAETFILVYLATKQYRLANVWRKQLELLLTSPVVRGYSRSLEGAYSYIGRCYLASQNYAQARIHLSKSLALGKLTNNRSFMANSCLLLFKVDSAQGNLLAAIAYYKRYKAINDSVFNEKNSKQIAGLQIQYDTEKKEQNIALLTKRNQVQQLTIRQRESQRNATLAGALLLCLLLGLGYNRYRLKQRGNRLLEEKQLLLETQQTEISQKNQSLEQVVSEKDQLLEERQELLAEKDWMLKEIHHRVKNNLQVVSSLLATQARYLRDPQALAAIRESENRVQVMAILHQKLYQSDSIARVNMAEYGRDIVTYLIQSFDHLHAVQTKLELASVEVEATLATPLGLIINEAVTNALKHAFPPPRRGTIMVSLLNLAPQQYQLTIADDGVGLPPDFDLKRSRSLGMVIMKGLSRQIDGDLSVTSTAGVCLTLQFTTTKKPVYAEAV